MVTRLTQFRSDDAASFYDSTQGHRTRLLLRDRLNAIMPSPRGRRILGIGYTPPYLPNNAQCAVSARLNHAQTRSDGCHVLPNCIVDSSRLPFDDNSMDTVLVVHGLEFTRSPLDFLRAVSRILTDDGTLILVVPNRSGFWAHTDATPFGHGVPYSTGQLTKLLDQAGLRVERHSGALMLPPASLKLTSGRLSERVGRLLGFPCAGVHVLTATPNAYAGTPLTSQTTRVPLPLQIAEPA